MKRPDTPLAATLEPISGTAKSKSTTIKKQKDGKYSASHTSYSSSTKSDGSSMNTLAKQKEKENGKIKYKSYDISTNKKGKPTALQITRQTNTGNSRTRVITNPKKIERKMERVLKRNQ